MQEFNLYFNIGIEHILNWEALDHILFVAALCLRYLLKDWRKVVVLVTAFTIGQKRKMPYPFLDRRADGARPGGMAAT